MGDDSGDDAGEDAGDDSGEGNNGGGGGGWACIKVSEEIRGEDVLGEGGGDEDCVLLGGLYVSGS